ncbi:hypothetical protein Q9L58_004073 [Maublancomyces gigas]|uniref:F-box domain-containing protein n=1 Tax=Discina gigas TaxID=1032678 RepID=A0ABR3GMC8_9PEZI
MAVLDDLAYETLVELLSLLSCTDLASTSRVSRRVHDVSEPLLYKAPELDKIRENPSAAGPTRPSLEILLRTLLTPGRERLGSHVRSLRLKLDNNTPDPACEYPDGTIAFLTSKAPKLGINNLPRSQGAQLMLLLDLLPRLHDLHITPPNSRDCFTRFLNPIVAMETLPRGLQSLRDIHYERTVNSSVVQSKRLLLLFKLPSIRSIDVPSSDICI